MHSTEHEAVEYQVLKLPLNSTLQLSGFANGQTDVCMCWHDRERSLVASHH